MQERINWVLNKLNDLDENQQGRCLTAISSLIDSHNYEKEQIAYELLKQELISYFDNTYNAKKEAVVAVVKVCSRRIDASSPASRAKGVEEILKHFNLSTDEFVRMVQK